MGEVIDHPRRARRLSEVRFKLVDAISRFGLEQSFRDLPEDEAEDLWHKAFSCETERPGDGILLLKQLKSGRSKEQSRLTY